MDKLITYTLKIDPKIWKKFKLKTVINDKSIKDTLLEVSTKYGK